MSQYLTKTELAKRWSNGLIEKHFPFCSLEKPNPKYIGGSPMQLYDMGKVRFIESTDAFKADKEKIMKRKIVALKRMERKREELIMYANGVQIVVPDYEKDKLIEKACEYYNACLSKGLGRCDSERATPSRSESFLKRITIHYLQCECTLCNKEVCEFLMKTRNKEALIVLQERVNDAIKQKYEWLR